MNALQIQQRVFDLIVDPNEQQKLHPHAEERLVESFFFIELCRQLIQDPRADILKDYKLSNCRKIVARLMRNPYFGEVVPSRLTSR